jgi:hypothetical protein
MKTKLFYIIGIALVAQAVLLVQGGEQRFVHRTAGNAVVGAAVQICSLSGACQLPKPTDADGKIESMLAEDGYKALIVSVPDGYVKPDNYVNFDEGSYTLTITIELE